MALMNKKTYEKPKIGDRIYVTTHYPVKNGIYSNNVRTDPSQKFGIVVPNIRHDDADSFRLRTENKIFPVSVINMKYVVGIKKENGENLKPSVNIKPQNQFKTWQIKSDSRKGGHYTVALESGHYSCTCPGYQYRKFCRHINKVKEAA